MDDGREDCNSEHTLGTARVSCSTESDFNGPEKLCLVPSALDFSLDWSRQQFCLRLNQWQGHPVRKLVLQKPRYAPRGSISRDGRSTREKSISEKSNREDPPNPHLASLFPSQFSQSGIKLKWVDSKPVEGCRSPLVERTSGGGGPQAPRLDGQMLGSNCTLFEDASCHAKWCKQVPVSARSDHMANHG